MIKKYSVKDISYFAILAFLGLVTAIIGLVLLFTSDIKGTQNDSIRASDFVNIKYGINTYISQKSSFPSNLKDVETVYPYKTYYSSSSSQKSSYIDPRTKDYYELKYNNDYKTYQLCANFEVGSKRINFTQFEFSKGNDCVNFTLETYYQAILKGENPNIYPGKEIPIDY